MRSGDPKTLPSFIPSASLFVLVLSYSEKPNGTKSAEGGGENMTVAIDTRLDLIFSESGKPF